jgi:hypothetical protein
MAHTLIILTTWEVEIRRIQIQGQPEQKVSEIPISTNGQVWWCTPIIPASAGSIK